MSKANDSRPLPELLGGLASDISTLFRKEVQLAKAEASEKVSETLASVGSIAIGGVLLLGALGVFLSAIVLVLAGFFLDQGLDPRLANVLSAFLVAAIVGVTGWVVMSKGLNAFRASSLKMNRTAASLGRDADIVKERL